jgi:hypothetical protein
MAIMIRESDYNFIVSSDNFCNNIDKYSSVLNVNPVFLTAYKEENQLLIYVFNNAGKYSSYAESFIQYKTQKMRPSFAELATACKNSSNYNMTIGEELGLEIPVYAFGYN